MKYDIYFHNDFDGRASAAVMLSFLRSRGDDIEHYTPVNFHMMDQWIDKDFFKKHKFFTGARNPAIVVDFPYHPAAAFWFDHHPTAFKTEKWRKNFKADKYHRYDPQYKSATHFVYASLKGGFGWKPPKHFGELVKWLDIFDGALYKSARQTIEKKEAALHVDIFIEKSEDDPRKAEGMIKLLAGKTLAEIAKMPEVRAAVLVDRKETAAGLKFYKKNLKVFGNASFIDLTKTNIKTLRFAPYYLFPKVLYAVRFTKPGDIYHLGVGANPWLRGKNKIHIGELMQRYGGGGHKGAGAVNFKTRKDAEEAIPKIIETLNRK